MGGMDRMFGLMLDSTTLTCAGIFLAGALLGTREIRHLVMKYMWLVVADMVVRLLKIDAPMLTYYILGGLMFVAGQLARYSLHRIIG